MSLKYAPPRGDLAVLSSSERSKKNPLTPPLSKEIPGVRLPSATDSHVVSAPPTVKPLVHPPQRRAGKRTSEAPSADDIQNAYKQLSRAAVELHTASDALGQPIEVWEAALKKLNLGVSAWVELSSGENGTQWWDRGIGYTKLKDWGIALRRREGDFTRPDDDREEVWPFNEAARWMRIEGISMLPELLEALLKQAEDTTNKIRTKIEQANGLAEAISRVADEMAVLIGGDNG